MVPLTIEQAVLDEGPDLRRRGDGRRGLIGVGPRPGRCDSAPSAASSAATCSPIASAAVSPGI